MKKIIPIIILSYICLEMLINSSLCLKAALLAFSIWKENVFPALFPFFVISSLLLNYGFVNILGNVFKKFMKLFNINKDCAYVFVMSIVSGIPSNAKYTKDLYLKGIINENEASKILCFTHFSNPLFILGTISIVFLNNKLLGLLILICQYITNMFIGLILRNYYPSYENKKVNTNEKQLPFSISFNKSIKDSMETLLLILGTITVCLVLYAILNEKLHCTGILEGIVSGIIEMTIGSKMISLVNISNNIKAIIIVMILSFGGLSTHLQVLSIIGDTKIKYFPYLISRLLHAFLAGGLLTIILFVFKII